MKKMIVAIAGIVFVAGMLFAAHHEVVKPA